MKVLEHIMMKEYMESLLVTEQIEGTKAEENGA